MSEWDPALAGDDESAAAPERTAGDRESGGDVAAPDLKFESVYDFVEEHLSDIYRRDVSNASQLQWCPHWWAHGEALSRLEALWRTWEHLRLDGATGMAVWWKDFADPTMAALFDPHGTFAGCSPERGHQPRLRQLPVVPMPIPELQWAMSDSEKRDPQRPSSTTEEN